MYSDFKVKAYLDRIGFDGDVKQDKETLDRLVYLHQCNVPFQTVSITQTPSLDEQDLYEKIVEHKLGGYCFELNKAFGLLLESLGFKTRPVLSRAVRGREGRMPINHRGIIAELDDGLYSVDVGFGGPMPAGALKLEEGKDQLIAGETFSVKNTDNGWWLIERLTRANFDTYDDEAPVRRQVELELCTVPVEEQDFDMLNGYFSLPGTLFRDHDLANLRTENGYLGYKDGVLTIRDNGQKQIIELASDEDIAQALEEYFGMKL